MREPFYYFNDDHLAILGTLLGGTILYGIESGLYRSMKESYEDRLGTAFQELENLEVISLDYNGTVHIETDVYDLVEVLIQPTQLLILEKTNMDGTHEKDIYYEYQNRVVHLSKGKVYHRISFETNKPLLSHSPLNISETLSKKDLEVVNDYMDWFDEEGAKEFLETKVQNADLMMKVIQKKHDEMNITYYHWEDDENITSDHIMVGFMREGVFEWQEEKESISISGGYKAYHAILEKMFKEV